jgi:cytochrome o ubiquinol oxidase subunit 1
MLFKGFVDALMMRAQQVFSVDDSFGYLSSSHFQQIFTAHGATMIFFVAMGTVIGLVNIILPLQIGARDVAFPFLNNLSFWLFVVGAAFINLSLVVGKFSAAGWLGYPPLTELQYSPGVGIDYWIWTLQISGAGTLLSGINFLVTIFKMRCPGMTLMRMPLFVWSILVTMVLIVFAFPIITATLGMLSLDRLFNMHFFTTGFGGNPMMFINLIWAWGHPEVYILILPAFGIFSEVVATFSGKRLFGYTAMVWALVAITVLSFLVWLHHFFTMGAGPAVNAFFGIMTALISIPTGVKLFNWLFTMYRGRVQLTTPMLWFLAFAILFTIGGMGGVLMAVPPADFQIHNSLFLIAHFHTMIIPGVLFGVFSGLTYWFPKITGFKLDETWGRIAWFFWVVGFILAFMPLYTLGFMGATRRLDHYDSSTGWRPFFIVAAIGAFLIAIGVLAQCIQIYVSYRKRRQYRDTTGDPWNGRTLEWPTHSPPPMYNFAWIPEVSGRDPFWAAKQQKTPQSPSPFEEIHMPKNTSMGFFIGLFSGAACFAIIWYMWWLLPISLVGIIVCIVIRLSDEHPEFTLSPETVGKIEAKRQAL